MRDLQVAPHDNCLAAFAEAAGDGLPRRGAALTRAGAARARRSSLVPVLVLAMLVPAVWVSGAPAADAESLDDLLAAFARVPGLVARFREEKRLQILEAPLTSEGTLYFAPPDRLLRRQESPEATSILLRDDTLWLEVGSDRQRIDLAAQPLVGAVVESFRALLAGDRAELDRRYRIEFRPQPVLEASVSSSESAAPSPSASADAPGGWTVVLTPLDSVLRRGVDSVTIGGRGVIVERLLVAETSGDETVVRFESVDADRRFSAEDLAELFRAPE